MSLARHLLEMHAVEERGPSAPASEIALRVDHALLAEAEAVLALLALASVGHDRITPELAVCVAGGVAVPLAFERADRVRWLGAASVAAGAHFVRAGAGTAHQVHAARFAAPGKVLVASGARAAACGGLGMLGFDVSEAEAAAVLAGLPLRLASPEVVRVRLVGSLPSWADVLDVSLAFDAHPARGRARGAVVEFEGPGVAALAVADRVLLALECRERGARAALFPSDDRLRAHLKAQGREHDWKPVAAREEERDAPAIELDLDALEPHVRDLEGVAKTAREIAGGSVEFVCVGPDAGLVHVERLAALLKGRSIPPGVELRLVPGSRQTLVSAAERGVLATLRGAGVRIDEVVGDDTPWRAAPRAASLAVGFALGRDASRRAPRLLETGLVTAIACALVGRVVDPRDVELNALSDHEPDAYVVRDERVQRPTPPGPLEPASAPTVRAPGPPRPLERPIRGVVLLKLGDRSGPGHVLGEGARDDMWSADLPALAARAFRALDSDFAARARRHGGGLLVAGARFGAATHPSGGARAAMVLAELGIRALLARSWVAEWRRDVIHYGGLPLSFADDRDYLALGPGDELEVPALPEGLEPRRPLVVRNLTQGTQLAVRHDLGAREIAIVRSGGLLGAVALAGDAPARKEG